MSVNLSPLAGAGAQFFTDSGTPLTGGLLYTYSAGTTTPRTTYTDNIGATANSNPIVLDAAGRVPYEIWLLFGLNYKFVLKTSVGVTIGTWDNISGVNGSPTATSFYADAFTATAGQVLFTLSANPGSINNLDVSLDGSTLVAGDDFSWSGISITLNTPAFVNQRLRVAYSTVDGVQAISPGSVIDNSVAVGTDLYNRIHDTVSVKDFGAVGDGVTDDTAAIQAALNSGAKVVRGVQGSTFLVSYASTRTVNSVAQRYCLLLPTGVLLDLDGATIKLASAQNASLFMSAASAADFGVVNGTIDGNKASQTTPATGDMSGIFLYAATRPRVESIKAINCRQYAGRFLDVTGGVFDRLHCTDSDGDGWSFGIDGGYTAQVRQAKIDNISAESCLGTYGGGLQGNPVIFCVQDCVIGTVRGKDCAGGSKVQDSSSNTSIAAVEFDGASNGSANSGFKVQGNSGAAIYPSNITVGAVSVRNAYGNGLYLTSIESVSIGSYAGKNNGSGAGATGSDQYDTKIDSTSSFGRKSVQIGSINIDTPKTTGINITGTGHEQIGSWLVRNATGRGFLDSKTGGSLYVGPGKVIDDAATLTYAFQSSGSAKGVLGAVDCTAAHSTSQSRVTIATANYDLSVGPVRLGNTDHLEGILTLTNGATSTTVANGNVWKDYVGGTSDYVCPAIRIEPIGSSARALGVMYAVITDGSSGTGFSIKHSAAGATDKVRYSISGMSVWSAPAT